MIRRLVRIGVLDDSRMRLDYVLALKTEDFLERRLQTQVFKLGYVDFGDGHANHTDIQTRQVCPPRPCPHQAEAHSSRQADRQRPIFRCPTRLPKVSPPPCFPISQLTHRHVDYALNSPFGGGRPGRVKRKRAKAAAGGEGGEEGGDDEDDE